MAAPTTSRDAMAKTRLRCSEDDVADGANELEAEPRLLPKETPEAPGSRAGPLRACETFRQICTVSTRQPSEAGMQGTPFAARLHEIFFPGGGVAVGPTG